MFVVALKKAKTLKNITRDRSFSVQFRGGPYSNACCRNIACGSRCFFQDHDLFIRKCGAGYNSRFIPVWQMQSEKENFADLRLSDTIYKMGRSRQQKKKIAKNLLTSEIDKAYTILFDRKAWRRVLHNRGVFPSERRHVEQHVVVDKGLAGDAYQRASMGGTYCFYIVLDSYNRFLVDS